MASPDTTPPSRFSVVVRGSRRITLHWSAAADAELEGYKLLVDGVVYAYPKTRHVATLRLGHHWRLVAYDLVDNETAATLR
ncbi:MAG TPA: hypothetical protein VGQ38_20570 [Gaiellaceae bacterium]|nr:hypothetical protein [Gaiellaceae bacterium]